MEKISKLCGCHIWKPPETDYVTTLTSELWIAVGGDRTDATGSVDASPPPLDVVDGGGTTQDLAATLGFGLGFGLGRGDGVEFRRKGLSAMEAPHPFESVHWT